MLVKNSIGGIDKELSKVRISSGTNTFMDPNKYSVGLINITSYVLNDSYLSKFSPFTINLLLADVTQLRLLENKNEDYKKSNISFSKIITM